MTTTRFPSVDLTFGETSGRLVMISGWRPGATLVKNCPQGAGSKVAIKLARIVFLPVPREIEYFKLMAMRDGAVVLNSATEANPRV